MRTKGDVLFNLICDMRMTSCQVNRAGVTPQSYAINKSMEVCRPKSVSITIIAKSSNWFFPIMFSRTMGLLIFDEDETTQRKEFCLCHSGIFC